MIESNNYHKKEDDEYFRLLSSALKDEIKEVNGKILAECKMLKLNFTQKCCFYLSRFMTERFLSPEEYLFFEEDNDSSAIHFISYGQIELYYRRKKVA